MKKKRVLVLLLAIISLVVITVGVSYAFFSYVKQGTTENSITTGTITFLYTEVSGVGKGIKIEDSLPTSDEQGKLQTGSGKEFEFKVTSDTTSNTNIPYEVTARKSSNSTLDEDVVRVYLVEIDDGIEKGVLLDNYSNLPTTDVSVPEGIVEKTIYKGKVPSGTKEYEKSFKLKMWLDENVDFSPIKDEDGNDTYPYNGKTFTLTVNVYANANVITESEKALEGNANIKSVGINNTEITKVEREDYQYESTLPKGTTEATIVVETENEYSKVKIEKIDSLVYNEKKLNVQRLSTKKTIELAPGDNYFKVTVISENNEVENEYKIKIRVEKPITIFGKEYDVIDAEPTLTTSSNNSNDESGLYKSTATNSGNPTYYFRGAVENNYVSFAGFTWRIVRINENGTIRLVMQNGINNNATYKFSSKYGNSYSMYYSNSDAKTTLDDWYNTNIGSNSDLASKIVRGDYFCEQAKVKYNTTDNPTMTVYLSYTPNFYCVKDVNQYDYVWSSVGLLTYDEVVYAGGYPYLSNYNYYLNNSSFWWTMSTPGQNGSTSNQWMVQSYGDINGHSVASSYSLRPVINLKSDVKASGTGTRSDPFVVE